MAQQPDISQFRYTGTRVLDLAATPTKLPDYYENKKDYIENLKAFKKQINKLQTMMYAHDRYAALLIFQAMDAAGKDGTISHVMSGINPHGLTIHSFKKPSSTELDHDFLWRCWRVMPRRGHIGIFNRSYYEEVLVVRVHPEIITKHQKIPHEQTIDLGRLWRQRFEDIRTFERYAFNNGIRIFKFFLNLSKEEQRQRFLSRLEEPDKNWKFSEADLRERGFWDDYQQAYQEAINATGSEFAPWYVVPADDKKNMRLIVSQIILEELHRLDMHYPVIDESRKGDFEKYRQILEAEGKEK